MPGDIKYPRSWWLGKMLQVASPVLKAAAEGALKEKMPVQSSRPELATASHIEGFFRTYLGIAPWLGLGGLEGEELDTQSQARQWVNDAYRNVHQFDFTLSRQCLVEAGLLGLTILRTDQDWTPGQHAAMIKILHTSKKHGPHNNNWLLFSAAVESALKKLDSPFDQIRIQSALKAFQLWYKGDGVYGDGPSFAFNYYNSIVIHPFLDHMEIDSKVLMDQEKRSERHTQSLERMIAPDGTFPVLGRSMSYRCGVFHLLADRAYMHKLPEGMTPAQVRCALAEVINRTLHTHDGNFDRNGWLRIGLCGDQPSLGEDYVSTGSLYMCLSAFLPLGLPPSDPFWTSADASFTSRKAWNGENIQADRALKKPTK